MKLEKLFAMSFASIYPHYLKKVETKGRRKEELDEVIRWMTGYSAEQFGEQLAAKKDIRGFFGEAPALHPNLDKVTGLICGVRVEQVEDPLMRKVRILDKLVDELAKGRPMGKILRG